MSNKNNKAGDKNEAIHDLSSLSDIEMIEDSPRTTYESTPQSVLDRKAIKKKPWIKDMKFQKVHSNLWNCSLIFLLETDPTFHGTVKLINSALENHKRKAVRVITEETIQKMALDFCFKSGERTPFAALCEAVRLAGGYKFCNKIPVELLAYMIKYMIVFERESFLKAEYNKNFLRYRDKKRYQAMALNYDLTTPESEKEETEDEKSVELERKSSITGKGEQEEKGKAGKKGKEEGKAKEAGKDKKGGKEKQTETEKETAKKKKASETNGPDEVPHPKRTNIFEILDEDFSANYLRNEPYMLWGGECAYIYEKLDTLLHKRGEINRDLYKFDDSPPHGPKLYVFISSFIEPELPQTLRNIKIPLNSYIFVGCALKEPVCRDIHIVTLADVIEEDDEEKNYSKYMKKYGNYFSFLTVMYIDLYAKKKYLKPMKVLENLDKDLKHFYDKFFKNFGDPKTYKHFEDIIMTKYVPDISKINFHSNQWVRNFLHILSNDITSLVYYFHKVTKLYEDYKKMIPSKKLKSSQPISQLEMSYYNIIMSMIPNEVISIPFILDTLIAQVCCNQRAHIGYNIGDYKLLVENKNKGKEFVSVMEEKVITLRKEYFPDLNTNQEPIQSKCILFGDQVSLKTHKYRAWGQLVRDRSNHILEAFFRKQWKIKTRQTKKLKKNEAYHYLHLLKACKYLNIQGGKSVIDLILSMLSLEIYDTSTKSLQVKAKTPRESENQQHWQTENRKESILTSCDDSDNISIASNFPTVLEALENIEKNMEREAKENILMDSIETEETCFHGKTSDDNKTFLDEINGKLNDEKVIDLITNMKYFEEMPKHVFLQTLWEAIQEFNTIDLNYVPIVNKIIYCCYNTPYTVTEEGLLPTHMCLRDFYKFGLTELKEWCKIREIDYYKEPLSDMFYTEIDKLKGNIKDPIEPTKITKDMDLIAEDFDYPRRCMDLIGNKTDKAKPIPINIKTKEAKPKSIFLPILYNIGKQKRSTLFTTIRDYVFFDSTTVTIKVYCLSYRTVDVILDIFQNGNHLIFHTPYRLNQNPKNLLFSHSSGINICFYEDLCKKGADETSSKSFSNEQDDNIVNDSVIINNNNQDDNESVALDELESVSGTGETVGTEQSEQQIDDMPKIKDPFGEESTLFECKFSLPNGLSLENKYTEDGDLYVKQYFLTKDRYVDLIQHELYRLHLSDGVLIKMSDDTSVEIYYPCGRFVKYCLYKHLIAEEVEEEEIDLTTANKTTSEEYDVGEEESLENVNKYFLLEPDGHFFLVVKNVKTLITKKSYEEYNDIFQDLRTVIFDKGPTFTFSGECIQTVTFFDGTRIISEVSITDEEVFCEWSIEELKQWFAGNWDEIVGEGFDEQVEETYARYDIEIDTNLARRSKEQKDNSRANVDHQSNVYEEQKIELSQDGFLWVIIESVMVEHPCYVSTIRFPSDRDKIIYALPKNIVITRYNNSCFDMNIEMDTKFYIRNDEIILEKYMHNELVQRSILWYKTFESDIELNTEDIILYTVDKIGNWLSVDKALTIRYNIRNELDVTEQGVFCEKCGTFHLESFIPKYSLTTSRRFIMDNNLNGTEILDEINVDKFKHVTKNTCIKRKSFQEDPFIVNIYLIPMDKNYGQWRKRYTNVNNDTGLFLLPSTYGPSWVFPFLDKVPKDCEDFPTLIVLRYLTEFIYENMYAVFCDIMKVYNMLILTDTEKMTQERLMKLKQVKGVDKFYDRAPPTTIIGREAKYLRKILYIDRIAIVDLRELNLYKDIITQPKEPYEGKFRFKRKFGKRHFIRKSFDIRNKIFVPYFDSPNGIAFYILDIVLSDAERIVARTHMDVDIRHLFSKPMLELTEDDLKDIILFLELFHEVIWGPKTDINTREVVRAAVELSEFFPNMKDALEFNVHYHEKYKVKDQCQDLGRTRAEELLQAQNRLFDLDNLIDLFEERPNPQDQVYDRNCS